MDKNTYLRLVDPAMELVVKKGEDYQSGVALEEYFPFGHASYVHMLNTKVLRLRSAVVSPRQMNFESVEDSVMDLINYAVFYLDFLQKAKNDKHL